MARNSNHSYIDARSYGQTSGSTYIDLRILDGGVTGVQIKPTNSGKAAIYTPGGVQEGSDIRIKKIRGNVTNILDKIKSLQPVYYSFLDSKEKVSSIVNLGLVAQEVEKVFPEVVDESEDGVHDFMVKTINYSALGAVVAVQGIKELLERLEQLEQKLSA
ncbi:tail fiber domain-containing protein [Parabacteroides faecis]|nr:tail fiber domain-containing protein [Parabacteroides faecis]